MQSPSSSSLNIVGPITVEAWIKINALGAYRAIISREAFQQSGTGGGYRLMITDTGKVRFDLFQTHNTYVNMSGTTTITTGVWHHVAGVFDGTQMRVYVNGVLDGTLSTTSGPASGTGNFHIGRYSLSTSPFYFNGLIDNARVSNTALYTSNFIPSTNPAATGSTKGLWKLDGSTNDLSGNNNHGTLQGGATYSGDGPGGASAAQVQWLISDQLGTPRMIVDQAGTLASVKRHDYLPFGEELFPPTGGRTAARGYSSGDGIRQQFTSKERDVETGLDYFEARYYSSTQGRFTSVDPGSFVPADPQSWNRYLYTQNNPLKFTDPTGEELYFTGDYAEGIVADLERFSGLKLQRDPTTGKVTIDKSQKRKTKGTSYYLAAALGKAIGDEKVKVAIKTIRESKDNEEVIIDSFARQKLDVDDIEAIKRDAPDLAAGLLTHVITEYYEAQLLPAPMSLEAIYLTGHSAALEAESDTVGDLNGNWWQQPRSDQTTSGQFVAPPETVRFKYSTVEYDIVFKSGVNGRATQVHKVTKIDKTPKSKKK